MTNNAGAALGRWFQPAEADPEASVRLFLFPYAGGNAPRMQREWQDLFPADVAVQSLQLPGRLDRRSEPPFLRMGPLIEAMCEAIAAEVDDRPYAFFGHSMGALLAYRVAVAMALEASGGPVLVASAGWSPEGFAMPTREQIDLPQDELVRWIVGLGSVPAELYQDPELLALTLPATRADLTACLEYVDDGAQVACPVVTYTGRSDPLVASDAMQAWAARCPVYLGNREFPGGHFFIHDAALAIAADLTGHLRHPALTAPTRIPPRERNSS
jgi:surfactin synthase thioesterase subunit